jgi:Zn-dependent protease
MGRDGSFRLGKLLGISFRIHYTWFIIFALITFSLSWEYFPRLYPFWNPAEYWAVGIATSLLFFASVVAHELSHSMVAKANGIPVKSITLFILGGVAHITREATRPTTELVMAIAGPLCSLTLGGLFYLISQLTTGLNEQVAALAAWLALVNVILAIFNMVPGFPLDGGRVLRSLLWRIKGDYKQATRIASLAGRGVGYTFILGGIVIVFTTAAFFNGLWFVFIGWFLEQAARTSYQQVVFRETLKDFTAADVMTTDCATIAPSLSLRQLVQDYVLPGGRRCFMVMEEGRLGGIITLQHIKKVPQQRWDMTLVRESMTPYDELRVVQPTESVLTILDQMDAEGMGLMPVGQEGKIIGMVIRDNLINLVRIRSELGR